ncbi:MAG TPA: LuxR C-terminal-related transcriptional regulator [Candidatus Angelobacter sp.]|nr:LuxR C-terminal-related transcriptional regulator [Candidatus Angelobacter sp.]
MKEPPIHILCYHPLVSQIIERILVPSGHRIYPFSAAQIQGLAEHEYILIIDTRSVERWLEITLRYGFMKKQPVILITYDLSPQDEIRVLYLGVRGIVPIANLENEIIPAVESMTSRRLWVRRDTLNEYILQRDGSADASLKFTSREQQILACLMEGFSNKEIGQILGISLRTVKFHVANILQKFRVKNRRGLRSIQNSQKPKPLMKIPA